jgi:hypothetical protein
VLLSAPVQARDRSIAHLNRGGVENSVGIIPSVPGEKRVEPGCFVTFADRALYDKEKSAHIMGPASLTCPARRGTLGVN